VLLADLRQYIDLAWVQRQRNDAVFASTMRVKQIFAGVKTGDWRPSSCVAQAADHYRCRYSMPNASKCSAVDRVYGLRWQAAEVIAASQNDLKMEMLTAKPGNGTQGLWTHLPTPYCEP